MKPKHLYLVFCFLGIALPYSQLLPWIAQHGLHLRLLVQELFVNRISSFFALDVIISSAVLLIFMRIESSRIGVRRLPSVLALVAVGVSLALPLFLYLRELRLEHGAAPASAP